MVQDLFPHGIALSSLIELFADEYLCKRDLYRSVLQRGIEGYCRKHKLEYQNPCSNLRGKPIMDREQIGRQWTKCGLCSMATVRCWWKVGGTGGSLMKEPLPASPCDVCPG
jgi:hypothetical protein